MSVIAVVNRKGGSGKSTLATHIAAYCALRGAAVAIADIDRQQSTKTWLRQRKACQGGEAMRITAWHVDPRSFVRPPAGIDHVVVDTPGGLTGLDLARVVMYADAIVVPVGSSIFDRESAASCLAELRTLPRVSSNKCRVAAIGMRVDPRTDAGSALMTWSDEQKLQIVAVLPQSDVYVRCIDKGLTLFDLPLDEMEADLAHWKPLMQWLRPLVRPAANANEPVVPGMASAASPGRAQSTPIVDQPKPPATLPAGPAVAAGGAPHHNENASPVKPQPSRGGLLGSLSIPGFLTRRS
ncbi:MAG: ParA family protein [Burkholderiaceae bacterium]